LCKNRRRSQSRNGRRKGRSGLGGLLERPGEQPGNSLAPADRSAGLLGDLGIRGEQFGNRLGVAFVICLGDREDERAEGLDVLGPAHCPVVLLAEGGGHGLLALSRREVVRRAGPEAGQSQRGQEDRRTFSHGQFSRNR
jgi:hypothetical protein